MGKQKSFNNQREGESYTYKPNNKKNSEGRKSFYQVGVGLFYSIAVLTPIDFFEAFDSNGVLIRPGMMLFQIFAYVCCIWFTLDYLNSKYLKKFPWIIMTISIVGLFIIPFYYFYGFWAMLIQIIRKIFCLGIAIALYDFYYKENR